MELPFFTEEWVKSLKSKLLRRENEAPEESISRLRSRKAEVEKEIESRRAATRFAPEADDAPTATGEKRLEQVLASEIEKTPALPPKIKRDEPADEEGSYTSRLLDAKRKVQQRQKRNKDDDV